MVLYCNFQLSTIIIIIYKVLNIINLIFYIRIACNEHNKYHGKCCMMSVQVVGRSSLAGSMKSLGLEVRQTAQGMVCYSKLCSGDP